MKKLILLLLIFLTVPLVSAWMIQYAPNDAAVYVGRPGNGRLIYSAFKITSTYAANITAVTLLHTSKVGSPDGGIILNLTTDSGGSPTTTKISASASAYKDYSEIALGNVTFNFSSPVQISSGLDFWIVLTSNISDGTDKSWYFGTLNHASSLASYKYSDDPSWSSWGNVKGIYIFYNYSVPASPPTPTTTAPTFVYPTPHDNQHNNTQPTINCSHTSADVNYYLYVDDTSVYYNITGNYSYGINYVGTFTEGDHNYTCNVQNVTSGIFSSNISRTFVYDITKPNITILGNHTIKTNNTKIAKFLSNMTLQLNFQDYNLYNILINITNVTNESVFSYINLSLNNVTIFNLF